MNNNIDITEEHRNQLVLIYKNIIDAPDSFFKEIRNDVYFLIKDINSGKRKHTSLYPLWFIESLNRLGYDLE